MSERNSTVKGGSTTLSERAARAVETGRLEVTPQEFEEIRDICRRGEGEEEGRSVARHLGLVGDGPFGAIELVVVFET